MPEIAENRPYLSKKKTVRFTENASLEFVSCCASNEDVEKRWYRLDDMRGFFTDVCDCIASDRGGAVGEDERDMRGLEHLTERLPEEIRARVRLAVRSVLDEQDRQRESGVRDVERIRAAVAASSEFAASSAARFGAAVATETRRSHLVRGSGILRAGKLWVGLKSTHNMGTAMASEAEGKRQIPSIKPCLVTRAAIAA